MEVFTLIRSYAYIKGMRKRYVSLIISRDLHDAHILIYENESKWSVSNVPVYEAVAEGEERASCGSSIETIEQLLQADDGSRKGAKYVVRLKGLCYVGINHVSLSGRLSVAAVLKSAFEKLVVGGKSSQENQKSTHGHQEKSRNRPENTGSAESYISTTSTPGTLTDSSQQHHQQQKQTRPASICGLPSLNNGSTEPSNSTNGGGSARPTTSLGLYFQDGSSTLMSFATTELMEQWLYCLTEVVKTNRSRKHFPHIEYASMVTCRFKAKEFNCGPFPKIKGQCLFCLSKLDVLLITQDIQHPDLSIRYPYVRNCASRDDGRLCLDIGRAAPTGECELVLQLPNAKEAKAAHNRCIMLMRQCPTWLKLGRDGPSSRRRTLLTFGKKPSGVNLVGPPLPRFPTSASATAAAAATSGSATNSSPSSTATPTTTPPTMTPITAEVAPRVPSESRLTPSSILPVLLETDVGPQTDNALPPPADEIAAPPPSVVGASPQPPLAFPRHSISHLTRSLKQQPQQQMHGSSASLVLLARKSHSFPTRLSTEPIPEVVGPEECSPGNAEEMPSPKDTEAISTPTHTEETNSAKPTTNRPDYTSASDITNHYVTINVDDQTGSLIKSIATYTVSNTGEGASAGGIGVGLGAMGNGMVAENEEVPSEETIRHVLAYLSSIARPSKAPSATDTGDLPSSSRSGTISSTSSRQPTVKFSPNPLMIPVEQPHGELYADPLMVGIDRLTTKAGSHSSEISRTSSTKKASFSSTGGVQLRRTKRDTNRSGAYTGSGSMGISSGGSGGSVASTSTNNRNRIYSHRDNDELFADLTYGASTSSSRHGTLCQSTKSNPVAGSSTNNNTDERTSGIFFDTVHTSLMEEPAVDDEGKRPRTSSDTGTKWKSGVTPPIRCLPSGVQLMETVSRPRARSLTHQLATKPLSQPIGVKDLENEATNGCMLLGSRSSSTTSTSKNIRRAFEHVLGRPRSTEEGESYAQNLNSPSHHNGSNKSRLQDSEIYVEMDFPPPPQPVPDSQMQSIVDGLPPEMKTALRGSLLITPSDSLSSNSSCLSFYGSGNGGGSLCGRQSVPVSRNPNGASFTEHYGLVFGQGMASTRVPLLIKSAGGNNAVPTAANSTGCDFSSH